MKKLDVLFGQTQHLQISDLADAISGNKTDIARAAMQLGLMQIKEIMARDVERGNELVLISSVRGKQ